MESNVAAVILPQSESVSHSIEARALANLASYLRRAPERTEREDFLARDAFTAGYLAGFRAGGKEASESWTALGTALNDKRLQLALATLLQFIETEAQLQSA